MLSPPNPLYPFYVQFRAGPDFLTPPSYEDPLRLDIFKCISRLYVKRKSRDLLQWIALVSLKATSCYMPGCKPCLVPNNIHSNLSGYVCVDIPSNMCSNS